MDIFELLNLSYILLFLQTQFPNVNSIFNNNNNKSCTERTVLLKYLKISKSLDTTDTDLKIILFRPSK